VLLDCRVERKIELILENTERTDGPGRLGRVPDVHDDAKDRTVAGRAWHFLRRATGAFGPRAMPCALAQQEREGDDRSHPPMQNHPQFPLPTPPPASWRGSRPSLSPRLDRSPKAPLVGLRQAENLLCDEI